MNTFKLLVAVVAVSGAGLFLVARFLQSSLEHEIGEQTPIGAPYERVLAYARSRGWKVTEQRNTGFFKQDHEFGRVVGVRSIRADLPVKRGLIGYRGTSVFWGFDENEKLIEFWVWRTYDAL